MTTELALKTSYEDNRKVSEDTNSTKYTNVHTRRKEENQMEKRKRLATSEDYPIEIIEVSC